MGKKNLIKSTTNNKKKKIAAKKKGGAKKTPSHGNEAASHKEAVKTLSSKNGIKEKTATMSDKKISPKDLIFKKFDQWKPDKLYIANHDTQFAENYKAVPFISENNEHGNRIKELLLLKFDLEAVRKQAAEKAVADKAAEEKVAVEEKAAAEKAAAEKLAAEKAAADKAAAEKAAAEKIAAEKLVAEEKAAAEKAAAEKAAAEKFAAEKAAADKAAAEKVAAEKAAAEKLVAEEKAAAEKAAAEKAAAEKFAAEKVAAEKAAEEKVVAEKLAAEKKELKKIAAKDSAKPKLKELLKGIIPIAAFAGFIALLLVPASFSNIKKYSINSIYNGIEILRGDFAPMGNSRFIILPGFKSSEPIKSVYTKQEINSLIFNYYIDRADAIKATKNPDLEEIKLYINKALPFVPDDDGRKSSIKYMDEINLQIKKMGEALKTKNIEAGKEPF